MGSSEIPTATAAADVAPSASGGFQRRSSGLVRDFSQTDTWMYNVLAMNPVVVGALTFGLVLITYPHANLWLCFLIAGIFCCAEAIGYALFASVIPRSGGDYVMQSRTFGGGVASVFSFSGIALTGLFVPGIFGFILSSVVLAPFFFLLGAEYNAHWMINVANWLSSNWGIFACAVFVAVQSVLINARGLRLYARVQKIVFWPGFVLLLFFIVQMLFSSHADFVGNFNSFMSKHYGVHGAYQATIHAGGTLTGGTSFSDTILASVIAAFLLIFPAYSVMQAGEIKRAGSVRANLWSMLGAEVVTVAIMAVLGALLVSKVGGNFLYASGQLYFSHAKSNPLPVPPFLGFFFAMFGNAPIYTWLLFFMFICWALTLYANGWVSAPRVIMAMSFDRVLPEWLGRVNRRFHVPLTAMIVLLVVSVPLSYFYVFQPSLQALTLGYFILYVTCFGVTMLAAAVFPYLRKSLFQGSPAASYKVAGVPLITIAGVLFFAFMLFCDYEAFFEDKLGVNNSTGLIFLFALWGFALLVYVTSKIYHTSRGESLDAAYRELPIE